MSLESLAKRVAETYGLLHQSNLGVLRHYIRTAIDANLAEEIKKIDDAALLRSLWEAGLSAWLQGVVLKQLEKIS